MIIYTTTKFKNFMRKHMAASLLILVSLLSFNTAQAAVDMFLDIDGISGESEDAEHGGEMDILAWSWGASTNGKKNCVQDLSVTKFVDLASGSLLMGQINQEVYSDLTLTVRTAGGDPVEYIILKLFHVQVTSLSTGGSGGEDKLTENVSFSFDSGEYKYTTLDETSSVTTPIPHDNCN